MDPIQGATTLERRLVHKAKQSKVPINGSIELLPLCNMNCDMYYHVLKWKLMADCVVLMSGYKLQRK